MSGFWQDFRYAARVLGKNPGVTAIMVFTLTLAIGATTAIFSVVYGVLLRPLPYSGANPSGRPPEVGLSRLAEPIVALRHEWQVASFRRGRLSTGLPSEVFN